MSIAFKPGGYEYITSLIADALARDERTAVVTDSCYIDRAVRIPSDFTLVLDGCTLCQADGCMDNIFVNEHHGTPEGTTAGGRDRNIRVIGRNGAVLDGGNYNGLGEKNAGRDGRPPIWKNNMILFTNVDGFEIADLHCRNQRWWALNFIYCANGYIHDLDFCSCDLWTDENGEMHHGLLRKKYAQVLVKNSDGIDLRQGCHDIVIENITGFTEDDTVALTALNGRMEQTFAVEGLSTAICRVQIRHITAAAYCSVIRLLNQGEICLHDISIEDVVDTSPDCPHLDGSVYTVRVGDGNHMYGSRHATKDETYNITIRGVRSHAVTAALHLAGQIGNLIIEDVQCAEGTRETEDMRS